MKQVYVVYINIQVIGVWEKIEEAEIMYNWLRNRKHDSVRIEAVPFNADVYGLAF